MAGPSGHTDSVYSVAFSPDNNVLVSASLDRTVKTWDLTKIPNGSNFNLGGSDFDPDGPIRCTNTMNGHKDFALCTVVTPDNHWVISGSKDCSMYFWDLRTGISQVMIQGHRNTVISVAVSPVGGFFAGASGDMRARVWSYGPHRTGQKSSGGE